MENILTEAHRIIYGEREQTYGDPSKNLRSIAGFWNHYIASKYGTDSRLTPTDVCAMMRLLKEARLINTPGHHDSLVDLCGYAALEERMQNADKEGTQKDSTAPAK